MLLAAAKEMTMTSIAVEPRFKLIYYPFRGRAELIRLIFEHLDIAYTDQRISFDEWAERKLGKYSTTRHLPEQSSELHLLQLQNLHLEFYQCSSLMAKLSLAAQP